MAPTSAAISSSLARRDGIGSPPSPLCAGLVLLAKPTAPCAIASRTIACISAISAGGAPGCVGAHHVGAHRRVADVGGDVDGRAAPAQLRHVFGEGLEVPGDALLE